MPLWIEPEAPYVKVMATRARRLLCHHCSVTITKADREHYGYQCHACVVREHELVLLMKSDPDHPGLDWLNSVPVDIGLPERG